MENPRKCWYEAKLLAKYFYDEIIYTKYRILKHQYASNNTLYVVSSMYLCNFERIIS